MGVSRIFQGGGRKGGRGGGGGARGGGSGEAGSRFSMPAYAYMPKSTLIYLMFQTRVAIFFRTIV